ncbi:radical SAM family heme chaperone HemW [Sulfoacidibacillus thermotolerans]|uniref:radical SAM family heme chaperone HemW n=1 Tax=Sulfoacidibacillus thermotolerans TaxID=1765684 RepID=UPI001FE3CE01|nr:radical SAM family heme chaperone HemW [Sulfoacidibacillus thermotolerans]
MHIPFCSSKCFYCDFNSYVTTEAVRKAYVESLLNELTMVHNEYFGVGARPQLQTIFFGGGTPTLLTIDEFERIAKRLGELFVQTTETEWTIEANPASMSLKKAQALLHMGVNRISFGAQTFNETLLQVIGRLHDAADVEESVRIAHDVGFHRVNLDLMLGLPGQTLDDVDESVTRALQLGISHLSAYGLKVEENTPFAKWQKEGFLHLPKEELEVAMYEFVQTRLRASGFEQYEISNFALPGEEARHNLHYWKNKPYLAVGAGAHGYVHGLRYENERSLVKYEERIAQKVRPIAEAHVVSAEEAMEDTMMLGLRLQSGVSREEFRQLHGKELDDVFGPLIKSLCERGWLLQDHQRVWIPAQYNEVANEIFALFVGYL